MSARRVSALACLLVALALGCNRGGAESPESAAPPTVAATSAPTVAAAADSPTPAATSDTAATAPLPRVVFLGDSLTAGFGVAVDEAFPAVLGRLLEAEGLPIDVVNAGVSGDTSAGGLSRTAWTLRQHADIVVLCLGGNDGLRGQPPANTAANLRKIIELATEARARVLLVGVELPPNYGPDYTHEFSALFPALAAQTGVAFVPSLLTDVGGHTELNQADGIHPTAEGHRRAAANVLPQLRALLQAP